MQRKYFLLPALILGLGISACDDSVYKPAPVLNLGLHADSTTGAMLTRAGDTVWDIAKRYRLPVRDIIDLNGLEPPYTLTDGQRLKLPAPVEYRFGAGDTLHQIASMFGVDMYRLVQINSLAPPYHVKPGQVLRIPSSLHQQALMQGPLPEKPVVSSAILPPPRPRPTVSSSPEDMRHPGFIWPVQGKIISSYGPMGDGLYNEGINISAPKGTPVKSSESGEVAYVGNDLKTYGNLVLIRHGGGMMTAYAHLGALRIKKGMKVRRGQYIGSVGSTGTVPNAQLHFEIRQGSKTLNPKQYLD